MRYVIVSAVLSGILAVPAVAVPWVKNERGVVGYPDTPVLPWIAFRKHDSERPQPKFVVAQPILAPAPADARVLFDGRSQSAFRASKWSVREGVLVAGDGDLVSEEEFGDCQIHLEFRTPATPSKELGNRGNSGLFPMLHYEIQIFDSHPSHAVQLYADGQCAAIYGETPPRHNACRAPGEWQSYDLVFTAPRFEGDRLVAPARVTLLHNGVLVHLEEPVRGPTTHRDILPYRPHAARLPLKLQGHGSAVEFRNVWVRPL
jgi:hypothetical protein